MDDSSHQFMDDSCITFIQNWMFLAIKLWMILVWNKFHPELHGCGNVIDSELFRNNYAHLFTGIIFLHLI